jgi:LPXTG-motif cell wall-anchored protein
LDNPLDFGYAVGYGQTGTDSLKNLVETYSPISALESYYDASGSTSTSDAAAAASDDENTIETSTPTDTITTNIVNAIADSISGIYCSNVTVSDTLSDYAQWTDASSLTLQVYDEDLIVKSSNAVDTDAVSSPVIAKTSVPIRNGEITASLQVVNGKRQIVVNFPENYQLPEGYKYSVTVTIVPTEEAYQYYASHNSYQMDDSGNLVVGGADTGVTSEGKCGFYSNADGANVTYTFGDAETQTTELYEKPVIQLKTVYKWNLFKVSKSSSGLKLAGAEFTLTGINATGEETGTGTAAETKYFGKSNAKGEVEWFDNGDYSGNAVTYIEPGTYTLKETKAPTGYQCSEDTWTVKLDYKTGITAEKNDTDENGAVTTTEVTPENYNADPVIDSNGVTIQTDVYNFEDDIVYELPSAGGAGIFLFVIAGMLLMMGGALLIFAKRRRVLRI